MFELRFVSSHDIGNRKAKLEEPSGLAFSADGRSLWTVCDHNDRVFNLDLDGNILSGFEIGADDPEGIATESTGRYLYVALEDGYRILRIAIAEQAIDAEAALPDIAGHDTIAPLIDAGENDNGLEGITWLDEGGGTLLCLNENHPGLLIRVSADLERILGHVELGEHNGFAPPEGGDVDFSGISYDKTRDACWIVSDKARRVFLFSLEENRVVHHQALTYLDTDDGERRPRLIRQAEGVAVSPTGDQLYVVGDRDQRLFIYDIGD